MQPTIHQFTLQEFEQFLKAQPSESTQRFELIEGVIYEMPPIGAEHAYTVDILTTLLVRSIEHPGYLVRVQSSIQIEESQPQPDLVVLRQSEALRHTLPGAEDCLLVVEVADSSVRYDREVKAALYARAGIPEYWLVNLPEGLIQQYEAPKEGEYRTLRLWRRGDMFTSAQFPDLSVLVTKIVGTE